MSCWQKEAKERARSHEKGLDRPPEMQPTRMLNVGPVERRATTKISAPRNPKRNPAETEGEVRSAYIPPQDDSAFSSHLVGEALARTTVDSTAGSTMIYDSGATMHMSPNRDRFIDFRRIEPKGVKAANKTVFMATGSGHMKINVPNGKGTHQQKCLGLV